MRRQSGICIELNHDRSIFLVEDGQFVIGLPAGNPSIGEKASFYPFEKKSIIRWQPIMAPVIAAVAAFILFMSVLVLPAEEAFGYVQVQINPGVELGINDQYEVVSVRELNSDGHDLIHQLGDWKNDSLFNVLNRVFDLAVTEKTKEIMITAVEEDDSEFDKAIKKVVLAVSSGMENEQLAIQMKEATKEQWRQAKENHIPVGQLIQKVETLKNQQPDMQKSGEETEAVTDPKEKKAVNEQKTKMENNEKNNEKEKKNNKPIDESKAIPPAVEKKTVPPAVEKKQDDSSSKAEQQQKTQKSNTETEEPANKSEKAPPAKEQEKAKPPKPAPKEKPAEKKEESKPQANSEAPGLQKKKNEPTVSSSSVNKTEPEQSLDQEKKKGQAPDHSREDKPQDQKENENSPISENKQGNKAKE